VSGLTRLAARAKLVIERARARSAFVDIAVRVFKRFSEDDGGSYAAALTYYTFFSIFPLLLFTASLLGFLTQDDPALRDRLIQEGVKTIPLLRDALTPGGIRFIIENKGNLAITGLILALYAGSGVIVALEHALNRFHGIRHEPNWFQKRLRSLKWLAILGLGGLTTIGLGSLAGFSSEIFGSGSAAATIVGITAFLGGIVINTLLFATAFKFLPAATQSWREVLPGAVVAAVAFGVLQIAGTAYLARGSQARNDTFGAFAGAAALLVASYLLSQIIFLSAEVNLVLQERKRLRESSLRD
jgi:YihY family inner membrane protein